VQATCAASGADRDFKTSVASLLTGRRINSASYDASGVVIASHHCSEIPGMDQAFRHALDYQAPINTVKGGQK
jgi:flagellin-like hook-associated protein FlgL